MITIEKVIFLECQKANLFYEMLLNIYKTIIIEDIL